MEVLPIGNPPEPPSGITLMGARRRRMPSAFLDEADAVDPDVGQPAPDQNPAVVLELHGQTRRGAADAPLADRDPATTPRRQWRVPIVSRERLLDREFLTEGENSVCQHYEKMLRNYPREPDGRASVPPGYPNRKPR